MVGGVVSAAAIVVFAPADAEACSCSRESTEDRFDRADLALTPLAATERAGFVWVCLTPGVEVDVDAFLGSFAAPLAELELDRWHIFEQRELAIFRCLRRSSSRSRHQHPDNTVPAILATCVLFDEQRTDWQVGRHDR